MTGEEHVKEDVNNTFLHLWVMMRNLYWVIKIGVLAISGLYYEGTFVIVIACYYCICLITTPAMFNITNVIAHILNMDILEYSA